MNTQEILEILLTDSFVRRSGVKVLARDQLPPRINRYKAAAFVVNVDPSWRPGSHWIGLYYNGLGSFEYFDSFGLPPFHADIVKFIERNSDRPCIYNPRPLQDILISTCGLFVIYFILIKCRGGSMRRVLAPFTTRQHVNDRLVWRLLRPWINKSKHVV